MTLALDGQPPAEPGARGSADVFDPYQSPIADPYVAWCEQAPAIEPDDEPETE